MHSSACFSVYSLIVSYSTRRLSSLRCRAGLFLLFTGKCLSGQRSRVDLRQLLSRKGRVLQSLDIAQDLGGLRSADQHGSHRPVPKDPGQGHLRKGLPAPGGDPVEPPDALYFVGGETALFEEAAVRAHAAVRRNAVEVSVGQDALGQRHANVTMDMPYAEVESHIRSAIEDYFKLELGRPEILNRIGENIVVFDYIREEAGKAILKAQVNKIVRRMQEQKQIEITIPEDAYQELSDAALRDLSNGGRGIGNQVEALLINPLSRWLFEHEILGNAHVIIEHFLTGEHPASVQCRLQEGEAS